MANTREYIIIHHTLVSRNKNKEQFDAIDRFHKSKGWGKIGYHYLIEPDGEVKQGRKDTEYGAHCKENLMNYRSIGICLTGNFDIEEPTKKQKEALLELLNKKQAEYGIPDKKVKLHRDFATYKSCPGTRIPNDIRGYLDLTDEVPEWAKDAMDWAKEQKITNGNRPNEPITRAEFVTMLFRYHKKRI